MLWSIAMMPTSQPLVKKRFGFKDLRSTNLLPIPPGFRLSIVSFDDKTGWRRQ